MSDGFEHFPYRGRRYPGKPALGAAILLLVIGAVSTWQNVQEGNTIVAVGVAWFSLTLVLGGVGVFQLDRGGRGRFRLLNAVVMTRAERRPADSWVHLAQTTALPWPLLLCNLLFTIGIGVASIAGLLQLVGIVPRINPDASWASIGLAVLIGAALTAAGGFLAFLNLGRKWRSGRFAARPSGVALGEQTVAVRVPGLDAEISWEHIRAVGPMQSGGRRPLPIIRLDLDSAAQGAGRTQLIEADGCTVPADALYSALRWYHAHPELRGELGRTEGQRRLEGWRAQALGRAAG